MTIASQHETVRQPARGFVSKLRAALLALALILPPVAIADEQPADAVACVRHWHHTDIEGEGPHFRERYSSWRIVPHHSACNDVNVSWASHRGAVKGQYRLQSGEVRNGAAGWVPLRAGVQWRWPQLITRLRNGTPYRLASLQPGGWYQTPV